MSLVERRSSCMSFPDLEAVILGKEPRGITLVGSVGGYCKNIMNFGHSMMHGYQVARL